MRGEHPHLYYNIQEGGWNHCHMDGVKESIRSLPCKEKDMSTKMSCWGDE